VCLVYSSSTSTKTVKSWVRLPGDIIFRLRLHQNLDPVDCRDCRLRVSLKRYAAFYSYGHWGTSLSYLGYHTVSRPPIHICRHRIKCNQHTVSRPPIHVCGLRIKCATSGTPRLLTTPGLNLMSYHSAQTSSARIQDVDVILI